MPPTSHERGLLFGMLALVNNFVDASALVAAFHACCVDPSKKLDQILVEGGTINEEDRDLVARLVVKHLAKHGDDVAKSFADLQVPNAIKAQLQSKIDVNAVPSFAGLGRNHINAEPSVATNYAAALASAPVPSIRFTRGDFHAKGGLGKVFKAEDHDVLKRQVALKEIQDDHADDPLSRARFEFEAAVTARLVPDLSSRPP